MARTGRPPKPTALKLITGNPGKRPLNAAEPRPRASAPRCPPWLSKEARAKWRALVPELSRLGLLTAVDGDALAGYCQACAELAEATRTLDREGRTYTVKESGYKAPHPAVAMQRSALRAVREFASLFGLDPSSRSRLSVPPERDREEAGELEAFIGG